MELIEYIAAYLRGYGFPHAAAGQLPAAPDRNAAVFATGLRARQDIEGSRFQILVRSSPGNNDGLNDAMYIADLLDDYQGCLSPDSPYIQRIELTNGVASIGSDESGRTTYSLNFVAFVC